MPNPTSKPSTLGEIKNSPWGREGSRLRSVKEEMRENLLKRLGSKEPLFPGIVGYDDTVVPQIANAILSRQNFILLGLRGQAKSRILRALTALLDVETPFLAGCEIHDNPFAPLCKACKERIREEGDLTPVAFLPRERRYVEKLATPDVTIADLIGDVDPIRAARGGHALSDELTIHYGLLPRANRGIFAVNELPDLAGKIQVGLFNIMQEGDIQIKGYPVRLPLDVVLVFSANPEDYTARGKIITPLKDRIGAEVRTHYPATIEEGVAITTQEAWTERGGAGRVLVAPFLREVVELVAFTAREAKHVDKRSGVSQRLPISCLENLVSNAERRAVLTGATTVIPRVSDLHMAVPSIVGKIELEYEGEMRGGDAVVRDLIREALGRAFSRRFSTEVFSEVVAWFNGGGVLKLSDLLSDAEALKALQAVPGLLPKAEALAGKGAPPGLVVAAAEFILEGLYAHQRIQRSQERGFHGSPAAPPRPVRRPVEEEDEDLPRPRRRNLN